MKAKRIYLDYNSTTPPWPEAVAGAQKAFKEWGNPSSVHQSAAGAKAILWEARSALARFLNCHPLELIFTGGASESNNQALKGLCLSPERDKNRNEILLSAVEHASVLSLKDFLSNQGFKVRLLPVLKSGALDMDAFSKALGPKTFLVSSMQANNETGALFPVKNLAQKAKAAGAFFHSDMVQSFGKIPIDLQDTGVDLAGFSAHKFHGLKGCGLLYCKKGIILESLIQGGPQERSRRAGTENISGIAAFGAIAATLLAKTKEETMKEAERIKNLRDKMEERLLNAIPDLQTAAKGVPRLPNTSLLILPGLEGETLLINLDLKGFSLSAGSACHSGRAEPGHVLKAMGFSEEEARSALRVSIGHETTEAETTAFVKALTQTVKKLRSLKSA